jgi:hypothetical protein
VIRRCRAVTKLGPGSLQSWAGDVIEILREAQAWLFTREPAVDWTNNTSERGAKAAKRHQAVCGYRHTQTTLARWCRIRSYLDSAAAHGLTALDAVTTALKGRSWLPVPAIEIGA